MPKICFYFLFNVVSKIKIGSHPTSIETINRTMERIIGGVQLGWHLLLEQDEGKLGLELVVVNLFYK